jgi:predicted acylesterase/phospholipase RssA
MSERTPTRALILAGGGLKVAFQAGVLQVWLDEAGIEFPVADAASGGVFNLAMLCSGKAGTDIADAWRNTSWLDLVGVNPRPWRSLSSLERFRRRALPKWGLDWDRIHEAKNATFNVYNFTRHELLALDAAQMNEKLLLAGVSLPLWFPPVEIDGDHYIDSVFATDANLEAAIRNGANELWVIWTVSTQGRWRTGWIDHYFQIVESAAVWRLKDLRRRIAASNDAIERDEHGEFPHRVELKILCAEVPLHYLLVFSDARLDEAVELGVQHARAWCTANGVPLPNAPAPQPPRDRTRVSFSERMAGPVAFGVDSPKEGAVVGAAAGTKLELRVKVDVAGLRAFLRDPGHEAQLTGWVRSDALGGRRLPLEAGVINLLVYDQDPALRKMLYRVFFRDGAGHPLTLTGEKLVPAPPARLRNSWRDTTTLFTRVLRGRVERPDDGNADVVAAGVIRIAPPALARQLVTFRGRGAAAGLGPVAAFISYFVGTLARVYLRR